MAEHDILNPTPTHPLNFDYGFQRKRPVTHLTAKANQGSPYQRELTDLAHQIVLNWAERETKHARALKQWYEQHKDGYFTLIDHEDGGRHYVGRFSTPVEPIPVSHNKWTVQYVTFDEIPGVNMLKYPSRWDTDSIWRYCRNDFGQLTVCVSGAGWAVENPQALAKSGVDLIDNAAAANDFASFSYVGYGFQFWSRMASSFGKANLYLDGNLVQLIDFYSATSAGAAQSQVIVEQTNVPLGIHTVALVATGTKNVSSSNTSIVWDALKVMR